MAKQATSISENPTQQQVREAFQDLYDQLGNAYWAATTTDTKDRIYGIEEVVYDLLMELDKRTLEANSAVYNEVKVRMETVIGRIDQLKRDIDGIIHAVKIAGNVTAAMDKAIGMAMKYFGL